MKLLSYLPFVSIGLVVWFAYCQNMAMMIGAAMIVCGTESYLAYKSLNHD